MDVEARPLTVAEAARALGISTARLRVLLADGRVRGAYRHGRAWAIPVPIEILPPRRRPRHCPWRGCANNINLGQGRRRCALGLAGVRGRPCSEYRPRPGLGPRQVPAWARK